MRSKLVSELISLAVIVRATVIVCVDARRAAKVNATDLATVKK